MCSKHTLVTQTDWSWDLLPRLVHYSGDELVLEDECSHLSYEVHEDDKDGEVLDPGELDQLPETWCIAGHGSRIQTETALNWKKGTVLCQDGGRLVPA